MIVCICRRVSDRDIERHASNGCGTFDELQMESGVSTCCGRCADCAREVCDQVVSRRVIPVRAVTHQAPAMA